MRLENRVVLVTGAAGAIGREVCPSSPGRAPGSR